MSAALPTDPPAAPADNWESTLRAKANEVVFQGMATGSISSLIVAAVIVVASDVARTSWWGWGWWVALGLVYGARLLVARRFLKAPPAQREADWRAWRRRIVWGSAAAGAAWSVALMPLWLASSWHDRVVYAMGVGGLLPGVTSALAAIPPAVSVFLAPVCLSIGLGLFVSAESPIDMMAAVISTALLPMLLRAARTLHVEFEHSTRLRLEQARLSRELEKARDAALASAGARSEFLAVMSHELRTPLNGVVGMTSLLLDEVKAPEQRELAQAARDSAHILLELIDGVLDLSRIDAGHLELNPADFALGTELERLRSLFDLRAREKGLRLEFVVAPGVPTRVRGDWFRLRQVLVNLLGNAFKFTARGEVVCTVRPAGAPSRLGFEVRDTGIGLTPAQRERIFEPFAQASAATAQTYGGTGLGLTICQRLVALMGGELKVDSAPGVGSTFHFEVDLPEAAAAPEETAPAAQPGEGRRVLVCDDNEINLAVASRLLERGGWSVTKARNGAEALASIEEQDVAVVLMDLQMPVMDGFEALRRARALGPQHRATRVPWVALTASASVAEREASLAAGFRAFLSKPIEPATLLRVVGELAGRRGDSGP